MSGEKSLHIPIQKTGHVIINEMKVSLSFTKLNPKKLNKLKSILLLDFFSVQNKNLPFF